jgi:hypothetical protein
VVVVALPVSAAHAAEASGCSGSVQSLMADGSALDTASAPGIGGTQDKPLVIDPKGSVMWQGATDTAITSGTWSVTVMGVPFRSGDIDNADGTTTGSGTVDLASAPAPVQWLLQTKAKIPVSGTMSGSGGNCSASGYLAGSGSAPLTSPVFLAGAGFAVLGALLALWMLLGTKATAVANAAATTGGGAAA